MRNCSIVIVPIIIRVEFKITKIRGHEIDFISIPQLFFSRKIVSFFHSPVGK